MIFRKRRKISWQREDGVAEMFDVFAETASGVTALSSVLASKTRTIRRFIISDLISDGAACRPHHNRITSRERRFTRAGIHFDDFADLYEQRNLTTAPVDRVAGLPPVPAVSPSGPDRYQRFPVQRSSAE